LSLEHSCALACAPRDETRRHGPGPVAARRSLFFKPALAGDRFQRWFVEPRPAANCRGWDQIRETTATRSSRGAPSARKRLRRPISRPPGAMRASALSDTSSWSAFAASTTRAAMLTSTPR